MQDDAAQFLSELVALAEPQQVITHCYHVDHRQQVHHRREFPTHLIYPEDGPQEFEQLINTWANASEGQILDGTGLCVGQIGRYKMADGIWTKHHQELQVRSIFNLPVSTDGQSTRTEQYSLIGLLCHSGTEHQSGHFFAILAYRGLYWLVDDGAFPRPITKLQTMMKTQIVQVWAMPSKLLLPANIPHDLDVKNTESAELEHRTKRQCLGGIKFDFANVTSLGQAVRQWLTGRERIPVFLAETHLAQDDHEKVLQWLSTRGFGVMGQAAAQSPKGGRHGGLLLVYPAHLHFHFVQKQIIDGCGWYAVHWTFDNFELIIVMVYFKCGEGLQGATNSLLWSGLMTFATAISKPLIVIGDFNLTPEEFMTTTIGTVLQMQVVATGEETCQSGRELDWALVTNYLAADVRIKNDWHVPFKPHSMLHVQLDCDITEVVVQQNQRFQPAPKVENIQLEWSQIPKHEPTVKWLHMDTNDLTQKVGSLYHKIERYVLHQHDRPRYGRGTQLQYIQKPLADPSKPWIWKRGALAFWAQIEVRLQHLRRANKASAVMQHLDRLGWHVQDHWHPDANVTLDGFMLLYHMLNKEHDDEHVQVLLKFSKEQWKLHQETTFSTETQEYRNWMNAASKKGCRGLFRTLKQDEMPYIRPFQHLPRQERMAQRETQWGKIWQLAEQAFEPSTLQALIYKGQQQAVELPTIHIHQVWQILRKLPQKAPGLDGAGYDFLRELPYQAMPDIIAILQDTKWDHSKSMECFPHCLVAKEC